MPPVSTTVKGHVAILESPKMPSAPRRKLLGKQTKHKDPLPTIVVEGCKAWPTRSYQYAQPLECKNIQFSLNHNQ